jgi:uncharacterized phiE125 gp8 family phage protein
MWFAPVIVTPAAAEPITRDQAKEFLRLDPDDTGFDTEVDGWIAAARDDAELITSTRLITQTVDLACCCFAELIALPIGPVSAIGSIKYLDTAGDEQTLDAASYALFGAGLARGVRLKPGYTWPTVLDAPDAVRVRLTVGYGADGGALPGSVKVALLRAIRGLFDDKPIELAELLHNHRIWL